jgi:ABC-type nitrate/sulfonate/bicarbonate transport system ATPase subunit
MLSITHVRKEFVAAGGAKTVVIDDLCFEIPPASIVAVLGPNGSGKTTFLRLLSGIDPNASGSVRIDGTDVRTLRTGFAPASNPVQGWRKAIDDIGISLETSDTAKLARRDVVAELVAQIGFELPLEKRGYELSSGQRQMVNVLRSFISCGKLSLLALDECWAALDPVSRGLLLRFIERDSLNYAPFVFLTSHQIETALRLADFVIPFCRKPQRITQADIIINPVGRDERSHRETFNYGSLVERISSLCQF